MPFYMVHSGNTKVNGLAHKMLVTFASASSKGSDEPAQMCSLARAFVSGTHKMKQMKAQTKIDPLDVPEWVLKGSFCAYAISTKILYDGPNSTFQEILKDPPIVASLPKDPMLNTWLNIKNNCFRERIKNWGMLCNSLCIPTFGYKFEVRKFSRFVRFTFPVK